MMEPTTKAMLTHTAVAISIALGLLAATGCGVNLDNENDVAMPASLRARVEAECGDDALILKAEEASLDAVCCVTYLGIIPQVHCLTGNGKSVANPTTSKLRRVAEQ